MKGIYEKTLLFDYYGELLTAHQREIYENVVMNDMSLSEAASEYGISRQGVHDLIKRCNEALEGFEKKLHMVEQTEKIRKAAEEISMTVAKRMQDRPGEKALPAMKKAAEKSPGAEKKNTSENEAELAKVRALAENILKAIQ